MVVPKSMKNRLAVLLGDFFWSSIPYDGLELHRLLSENYSVDLLMFENDIRLTKEWRGDEAFFFEKAFFKPDRRFRNWSELYQASSDYDLILAPTHIAPKTRYPHDFKKNMKSRVFAWDVGGADILWNATWFAENFFVKSSIWGDWLKSRVPGCQAIVTGSPHFDAYQNEWNETAFRKKYGFGSSHIILVAPSNPGSHREQFDQNLLNLESLCRLADDRDVKIALKTYPGDYLFYEKESSYSGVYKRIYGDRPQYQFLLDRFPLTLIQSQDHHQIMRAARKLFNMSGSHLAWETWFTDCVSFSMNYHNKPYFGSVTYLPGVTYPDEKLNIDLKSVESIFDDVMSDKAGSDAYFLRTNAVSNIVQAVRELI